MESAAQVTVLSFAMDLFEDCDLFSRVQPFYHKFKALGTRVYTRPLRIIIPTVHCHTDFEKTLFFLGLA